MTWISFVLIYFSIGAIVSAIMNAVTGDEENFFNLAYPAMFWPPFVLIATFYYPALIANKLLKYGIRRIRS